MNFLLWIFSLGFEFSIVDVEFMVVDIQFIVVDVKFIVAVYVMSFEH